MRLIDVDEIRLPKGLFEKIDNVPKFYEWLGTLPTVDAVEVVRCKDCKWYERRYPWSGHVYYECSYIEAPMDDNDYCSLGERRENDKG